MYTSDERVLNFLQTFHPPPRSRCYSPPPSRANAFLLVNAISRYKKEEETVGPRKARSSDVVVFWRVLEGFPRSDIREECANECNKTRCAEGRSCLCRFDRCRQLRYVDGCEQQEGLLRMEIGGERDEEDSTLEKILRRCALISLLFLLCTLVVFCKKKGRIRKRGQWGGYRLRLWVVRPGRSLTRRLAEGGAEAERSFTHSFSQPASQPASPFVLESERDGTRDFGAATKRTHGRKSQVHSQ